MDLQTFTDHLYTYTQKIIAWIVHPLENVELSVSWILFFANLIIATIWFFYINSGKGKDFSHWLRFMFSPKVWLHKSSRLDLMVNLINGLLFSTILVGLLVPSSQVANGTISLLTNWLGSPARTNTNITFFSILYTISMFIYMEFFFYWAHRWSHQIPFLWKLHKRHHTAEVLSPLTISRSHPLAIIITLNFYALVFGLGSGTFVYFAHTQVGEYQLLGLNIISCVIAGLGGLLSHTHLQIHFPRFLSKFIVSPVMHQVHHSKEVRHYDKNFASSLAIYDHLFGTIHIPPKGEKYEFGVEEGPGKKTEQTLTEFYFKL